MGRGLRKEQPSAYGSLGGRGKYDGKHHILKNGFVSGTAEGSRMPLWSHTRQTANGWGWRGEGGFLSNSCPMEECPPEGLPGAAADSHPQASLGTKGFIAHSHGQGCLSAYLGQDFQ